jgi:anti-anti-sigma regulatory factor
MASKPKGDTPATKSEARVGIPADCRIASVGDLHAHLREALNAPQIVLDGTTVDRIDTAALQLLVAFQRDAQQQGRQVNWLGASGPLHDAATQLGLAQVLALPAKSLA